MTKFGWSDLSYSFGDVLPVAVRINESGIQGDDSGLRINIWEISLQDFKESSV